MNEINAFIHSLRSLIRAVSKHGVGKWADMLEDKVYGPIVSNFFLKILNIYRHFAFCMQLSQRTNVNLKDKYRSLKEKGFNMDEDSD